ncbi:MAG: PQQ-binding-like beta-propeller repeat protein [Planctomycetota bacterium]|nr:PQQ-binding-like beta-propeller repeat protein [Planctomycetota bacterium]
MTKHRDPMVRLRWPRLAISTLAAIFVLTTVGHADWRSFRNGGTGELVAQNPPIKWDVKTGENVAWKTALPGKGVSSPIVVGDKVFVTASDGPRQSRLHVICLDAATGKKVWEHQFWATGRTLAHETSAVAAPTPTSDGERVFAFFSSNDLVCLDLEGNLQWYRGLGYDYPTAGNDVGMSSSPVVTEDCVIVQIESQGESFATGLNKETGEDKWHVKRAKSANWSSPVIFTSGSDKTELVLLQSAAELTALDASTGEQRWNYQHECDGISSSAIDGDKIFLPGGGLKALRANSKNSPPEVLWTEPKMAAGAASPVVHDGTVMIVNRAGVVNCASTEDGKVLWQLRVKGKFWSTPLVAGGRMYLANQDGLVQVLQLSKSRGEELAALEFGEEILASPAVSRDALYYRTTGHLWKIAASK